MKKIWTKSVHKWALDYFFSELDVEYSLCNLCPVAAYADCSSPHDYLNSCKICRKYVGISILRLAVWYIRREILFLLNKLNDTYGFIDGFPCSCCILGEFEAMKRSHLKLEIVGWV